MNRYVYRLASYSSSNKLTFVCPEAGSENNYGGIVTYNHTSQTWRTVSKGYVISRAESEAIGASSVINNIPGYIGLSSEDLNTGETCSIYISNEGVTVSDPTGSSPNEVATTGYVGTAITAAIGTAIGGSY